jgi:hypothetical protein
MPTPSLSGQVALVTGGAVRLGRVIAHALTAEGMGVIIHYRRSKAPAEELAAELKNQDVSVWLLQADLDDEQALAGIIPRALTFAGRLDLLVNNASEFPRAALSDVTLEQMNQMFRTNAWAPFALGRAFAQQVGSGSIVNLLDTRMNGYDFAHVSYIVAKHALGLLTSMMALEFAPEVRVNAIAPGLILPPPGQEESYLDALVHTVPLQRHGDVRDVAAAAVYLAQSSFLTGQVIYVDGGRHLKEYPIGQNSH